LTESDPSAAQTTEALTTSEDEAASTGDGVTGEDDSPIPPYDDVTSLNEDGDYYAADHSSSASASDSTSAEPETAATQGRFNRARLDGAFSRFAGAGVGWDEKAGSYIGRVFGPVEQALRPTRILLATRGQRAVTAIGVVLTLLSLLADSAGFALIVLGIVTPVLMVLAVLEEDVFEKEPFVILTALGIAGLLMGLILGGLGSWVMSEQWFDTGKLNYGAAGYGGRYADAAGDPNWIIYLWNATLMPLIALAALFALPTLMRRIQRFRNEIMDGAILGAIVTAGYAIGTTIVFLAPGIGDGLPRASVSDWTLITLGIVITRPTILVLGGAMMGIAIWRYNREQNLRAIIRPVIGSLVFWLLLSFSTVQLQASGVSVEFVFQLVLAFAAVALFLQSIAEAVEIDQRVLGVNGNRIVCPHCHKVTPVGAFCANCGKSLTDA